MHVPTSVLNVSGGFMNAKLTAIDILLTRIERLAEDLSADPDGHVRRSTAELRATFAARGAVEPAVARVRDSVVMLRRGNQEGSRREFQRRAHTVDHLEQVVEGELLPTLRRLGFEV
jgi:hypothetical protein